MISEHQDFANRPVKRSLFAPHVNDLRLTIGENRGDPSVTGDPTNRLCRQQCAALGNALPRPPRLRRLPRPPDKIVEVDDHAHMRSGSRSRRNGVRLRGVRCVCVARSEPVEPVPTDTDQRVGTTLRRSSLRVLPRRFVAPLCLDPGIQRPSNHLSRFGVQRGDDLCHPGMAFVRFQRTLCPQILVRIDPAFVICASSPTVQFTGQLIRRQLGCHCREYCSVALRCFRTFRVHDIGNHPGL